MSVQLLDKTRKINKLLHNNNSSKVVFTDICEVLKMCIRDSYDTARQNFASKVRRSSWENQKR